MAVFRARIEAVAAKIETTEGTDSVPSLATDAIRTVGVPTLKLQWLESGQAEVQFGGLGQKGRRAPKGRYGTIDIVLEMRGKGSAYTASTEYIEADIFWRGAMMSKSYAAGVVSYTTLDTGGETFSLYLYSGGRLYKLVGCIAKPQITLSPGKPALVTFSVIGRLASESTAALTTPASAGFAITPPVWGEGATATTIGAWSTAAVAPGTLVPRSMAIDFGTTEVMRPSAGAQVFQGVAIVDRNVKVSAVVEAVAGTYFEPHANAAAAGDALTGATNIVTQCEGGTGNIIGFRTGTWELEEPDLTNDGGMIVWGLTGQITAGSHSNGREIEIRYS